MIDAQDVSVVIPSRDRGAVLLDTIAQLLALPHPPLEIVVVDQSAEHPPLVAAALEAHYACGAIRWQRQPRPGIMPAMNTGARLARGEAVLFLDDDVAITSDLAHEHARALNRPGAGIVAGRIVQPWQRDLALAPRRADAGDTDPDVVALHATCAGPVRRFGGGNFSLRRRDLVAAGGFDENFVAVAYRFEADFAERALACGIRIHFEPRASVDHLKAPSGGTRSFGSHLRTAAPAHSAGRYYYLLRHPGVPGILRRTLTETARVVASPQHLRAPWWAALCLLAELRGLVAALRAQVRGPRLTLLTARDDGSGTMAPR